ncbi:MAG TPA: MBL fold metallo-hydrolase [Acetobacteraceae bacterium]|nr:MBL fold metallo-hydrolase [Acetobacteraceae bacterium]
MPFLTEPEPERGAVLPVMPGISRIVAANPGPMTYYGTNTYLIETPDGIAVLDPGPESHPEHVEAILRATGPDIALILVSHTHHDHVGAVPALQQATGAPTVGFRDSGDDSFNADIRLSDGDVIAGMTAVHTPGHASDHVCLALPARDGTAVLFSADHVMSWSTSVVSPPGGNMSDYFASLRRLLDRADDVFLPGHGPPLPEPRNLVREMLTHRMMREQAIQRKLTQGPANTYVLMDTLYSQVHPRLRRAAERNVLAHLLKLEQEGKVHRDGEQWRAA